MTPIACNIINTSFLETRYSLKQDLKNVLKQGINESNIQTAQTLLNKWKNEGCCVTQSDKRLMQNIVTRLDLSNLFSIDNENCHKPSEDILQTIRDYKQQKRNEEKNQKQSLSPIGNSASLEISPKKVFFAAMYIVAGLIAVVAVASLGLSHFSCSPPLPQFDNKNPPIQPSLFPSKITKLQECVPGLQIHESLSARLEELSFGFYKGIDYPEIKQTFYQDRSVADFSLEGDNEFEFKYVPSFWVPKQDLEAVCQKSMAAHKVISDNNLHLLNLPPSSLLTFEREGNSFSLIVQKKLKTLSNTSDPVERPYDLHSDKMEKTVTQLAEFIGKTNWKITPYNAPLLAVENESDDSIQVGIQDISFDMDTRDATKEDLKRAFYHPILPLSPGLLQFVDEKHFPIVESEADKHGVKFSDAEIKNIKMQKNDNAKLRIFYNEKKIVTGKELIDTNSYCLIERAIAHEINKQITFRTSAEWVSIKTKRTIYLNFGRSIDGVEGSDKYLEALKALKEMVTKKHIFKIKSMDKFNGDICIQA
ncbi:MAG TPA: hypothetical protein VGP47_04500 [Parachlamydiaceae bacterium]|nr:hypothetical protein [Parachlamydiaceae bacterium]